MVDQNELAHLEAERDRLLSMIAYHNGPFYRMNSMLQTPAWFSIIAAVVVCAIGIAMVAGLFAGQISSSDFLFLVVGLPLLTYILSRLTTGFREPAGEPQIRQRLADCEARIAELRATGP